MDRTEERRGSEFQNVTDDWSLNRVNNEISDNRLALRILEEEIAALEAHQQVAGGDLDADFENANRHMSLKTYTPYFSAFFLALNIAMFIASIGVNGWTIEELQTNPLFGPSVQTLLDLGAKDTELIQEQQEYWRLFTPMILHVGVVHLVANMLGLVMIGIPLEQEFGPLRIGIIVISSGFVGVLCSSVFAPRVIGVGASGAIYGLFGAAWADLLQNWNIYKGQNYSLLCKLSFYTILNFMIGLMPYLDNFAHLGGFLCGLVWGLTLLVKARYDYYGAKKVRKNYQLGLQAAAIILLPILVVSLLLIVFLDVDVASNCDFCSYFSCVPFPPGVAQADLWWDCTPCLNGFGDYENFVPGIDTFTVTILCPTPVNGTTNAVTRIFRPLVSEADFKRGFAQYCRTACELGL